MPSMLAIALIGCYGPGKRSLTRYNREGEYMKRKFSVYHSPGFNGESESVIHIFAYDAEDAKRAVMTYGVGIRNGKPVIPLRIRCAVEVKPDDFE